MTITKTELLVLCDNYFVTREKTDKWLKTTILALGNKTPESLIVTEDGIEQVHDCIRKMQSGNTA